MTATGLRGALITLLSVGLLAGAILPALAQAEDDLVVSIRGSSFEGDGSSAVQVNVSGPAREVQLDAGAFTVTENGEPIEGLEVEPLTDTGDIQVATTLAIDASSSMEGPLLDSIKAASSELVVTLNEQGIAVGLLEFATLTTELVQPTTDTDRLLDEIDAIEVSGSTALYDAVIAGLEQLGRLDDDVVTSLIVLADGEDNMSTATLEEALETATTAEVPVTVIAFETELFEPEVLLPLANETGGRFITTDDIDEFDDIFAEVAGDVASQYTISYRSDVIDPAELDIEVAVASGGTTADVAFVVPNPRSLAAGAGQPIDPQAVPRRDDGFLGTDTALWIATGIAFLALAAFLLLLLVPRGDRQASRTLQRGLSVVERAGGGGAPRPNSGLTASGIGERAVEVVGHVPRPKDWDERKQLELDRAGWQLRAGELLTLRILVGFAAGALLWALTGELLFGVLAVIGGYFAPMLVLSVAVQKRQDRFMEQLPDTLQLLAGTLKAGYGILQALDTVVKEMDDPISTEFQRVLTEARLGLPLEDALEAMAERIDREDFRWVTVAMNIQRQIGGNLAELLETVAETLRGREQVRRQIQVLSAEGKLSAVVLVALPPLILGYLLLTNPGYLEPIIVNPIGWIMGGVAVLLMFLGIFWMSKLIKIDV